jgi:hypothetical protein
MTLLFFHVKSLKTEILLNNEENSVRTSQETDYVSATKTNRLMLLREKNRSPYIDGLRAGRPGSIAGRGKIFLYSTASRLALGITQPPIHWILGALSSRVKRSGPETGHSPPSSAEIKNGGATPPLPIRLCGIVLN